MNRNQQYCKADLVETLEAIECNEQAADASPGKRLNRPFDARVPAEVAGVRCQQGLDGVGRQQRYRGDRQGDSERTAGIWARAHRAACGEAVHHLMGKDHRPRA